ncbi:hypothetical protein GCM10010398_69460 [Streptomyces fimbriatus]
MAPVMPPAGGAVLRAGTAPGPTSPPPAFPPDGADARRRHARRTDASAQSHHGLLVRLSQKSANPHRLPGRWGRVAFVCHGAQRTVCRVPTTARLMHTIRASLLGR